MNIRGYALDALIKIDKDQAYSNLVVKEYLTKYSFSSEDKGLFTNIVYGVVTNIKYLNFILSHYVKRPHKQQYWLKNLLMMCAYEIYFLNTPEFAITSESVKLAKKRGGLNKGNFVNAVLRSIIRGKGKIEIPTENTIEFLGIKYSLESWMIEEFAKIFTDEAELEEFCKSLNKELPLTLRINTLKNNKGQIIQQLEDMGIEAKVSELAQDAIVLQKKVPINIIKQLLDEGICVIQDQGSIFATEALAPVPGDLVLDMCAAPGGKSTHMAQLMDNKGEIVSCDIHDHKLELIQDLVNRLGITIISTRKLDGTQATDEFPEKSFDKILLDAPCTGLGVISNKPDIKWNKKQEDMYAIASIQKELIRNAGYLLKPGGTLVYSTCTVTIAENEAIVSEFLTKNKDFTLKWEKRLYPHKNNSHGFYIAKIIRGE